MAAHLGNGEVPAVAGSVTVDWSADALADLNRFAAFLEEHSPELAPVIAEALIARTEMLAHHPKLGRAIAGQDEYRQLVLDVLGGAYVFQYRYDGVRVVMLRVFHARIGLLTICRAFVTRCWWRTAISDVGILGVCDKLFRTARKSLILKDGEMSEWLKEHAWKANPESLPERYRDSGFHTRFSNLRRQHVRRCEAVSDGIPRPDPGPPYTVSTQFLL